MRKPPRTPKVALSADDILAVRSGVAPDPKVTDRLQRAIGAGDAVEDPWARATRPSFPAPNASALRRCLEPLSTDSLVEAWGHTPLHVSGSGRAGRFADLLSLEALDELLTAGSIPRDTIYVLDAKRRPRTEFNALDAEEDLGADLATSGASLYFHLIDRFCPSLRRFCDALEAAVGMPVCAFGFLNPPRAQARQLHWDPLDVFVLQIEGNKIWRLHEPLVHLPLAEQDSRNYRFDTPLASRVHLHPGDMLYVPRGVIHEAASTSDISLSVTIGVRSLAWQHAISEALRAVSTDRTLHGDDAGAMVQQLIARVREEATPDKMADRALSEPRPMGVPKLELPAGSVLLAYLPDGELARLSFARSATPYRISERAGRSTLVQRGQRVELSPPELACVRWLEPRRTVSFASIAKRFPRVDVRDLLRRLVASGFVAAATAPPAARAHAHASS